MKFILLICFFSILSHIVYCQSQAKVFESSVHPGWALTDSTKTSDSKENKTTKWTEAQKQKNAKIIVGSSFAGIGFGLIYWQIRQSIGDLFNQNARTIKNII